MEYLGELLISLPLQGEEARRRDIILALAYLDGQKPETAVSVSKRFLAEDQFQDETNFTMRRILGIAAYAKTPERPAAIATLEDCLALPDAVVGRIQAVRILAQLYRLENRLTDEEELLRRELEHPRIKASGQLADLQEQYRRVSREKSVDVEFNLFLADWMSKLGPKWFDFALPKTAHLPQLGDPATLMASAEFFFNPIERLKYLLLAAGDKELSYSERVEAWNDAAIDYTFLLPDQPMADTVFSSVINNELLTEELRHHWLWMAIYDAGSRHQKERFETLKKNPLIKFFNPQQIQAIHTLETISSLDVCSLPALQKSFSSLGSTSLDSVALEQTQAIFEAVLRLGELESAEKLYHQFKTFSFSREVDRSQTALALDMLRKLKQARRFSPVQIALREAVLRRFSAKEITRPPVYDTLRDPLDSELLHVSNGQEIRLYRVLMKQIDPDDFDFWMDFAHDVDTASERSFRMELATILIQKARDDHVKSKGLLTAANIFDLDEPIERAACLKLLESARDATEWPLSAKTARLIEGRIAHRTGDTVGYKNLILKNGADNGLEDTDWLSIEFHFQQRNANDLREAIRDLKVEDALSPMNVETAIGVLEMAGLEDEASLARDVGRKVLYDLILDCWVHPTEGTLSSIFDLAETLGEHDLIPESWIDDMTKRVQAPFARLNLLIDVARMRKNWSEVEKLATEAMAKFPTYYHFYWFHGEALRHLGRKAEAVPSIQVYAKHAKDERHYFTALEWLEEAQSQ